MRLLLAALALAATPLAAHEYRVQSMTIDHPFAFETTTDEAMGFVIIVNEGAADKLLGVDAGPLSAELMGPDAPLPIIPVPAGGAAELLPDGMHIRFTGLTEAWEEGDQIAATLFFETAGEVPVVFYVEPKDE